MNTLLRLFALLVFLASALCRAEPSSFNPPAEAREKLLPLLATEDPLAGLDAAKLPDAEDGLIVLDDEAVWLNDDARRYVARRRVTKALTQAGAEAISRQSVPFRKTAQRISIVRAETIQPDGRRLPVNRGAAFIQSPQRDADYALYDDQAELVVVFPDVKAGSVIELTTILVEDKPRIAGHYTAAMHFAAGWPTVRCRRVVDVPEKRAAELRMTSTGTGVPDAKKETADGRTRWTWERRECAPARVEFSGPPIAQRGPVLWLTTLRDWEQFLAWYAPLAEARAKAGPKLAGAVGEITKGAKDEREIIERLARRVADDVRYVGLEFGRCDIEPHGVDEIWEHQYGDCKDKASLLRAMLAVKGIASHLALVDTEHTGRIERGSPDYRHFNHAILAIEQREGGLLFCDPTIEGSAAGTLSPGDVDREVLLVKTPVTWARTPRQAAGNLRTAFDAKVSATGEISGWMTFEASGYYAAYYRARAARGSKDELRDRLSRIVGDCWEGARVVDTKAGEAAGDGYKVQAYFVVPTGDAASLAFPYSGGGLPYLQSGRRKRQTEYLLRSETIEVEGRFELPAGISAGQPPAPHTHSSPFFESQARWNTRDGKLEAKLTFRTKANIIPAPDCEAAAIALDTFRNWLSRRLTLQPGPGAAPALAADDLGDFPQMPTGDGQLELVNERFPIGGNRALRRAALERTMQYFPHDATVKLEAGALLGLMDVYAEEHDAAIARVRPLLAGLRGKASEEVSGFAEYVIGLAFEGKKEDKEALAIFTRLQESAVLSKARHAYAAYHRAKILAKTDVPKALAVAREGLALEAGNEGIIFALIARVLIENDRGAELATEIAALAENGAEGTERLVAVASLARELAASAPARARTLIALLEPVAPNLGAEFNDELTTAKRAEKHGELHVKLRNRLKDFLAAHTAELPVAEIPPALKTREDFLAAAEKVNDEVGKAATGLRYIIEALVRFEPDENYSHHLWRAAAFAEWMDRGRKENGLLLDELLALCDGCGPGEIGNIEGRLLRASIHAKRGEHAKARGVLTDLSSRTTLSEAERAVLFARLGDVEMAAGNFDAALAAFAKLEPMMHFGIAIESGVKAACIHLARNEHDKALAAIALLTKAPSSAVQASDAAGEAKLFIGLGKTPEAARAWWRSSEAWWPAWEAIEGKLGGPKTALFVPVMNTPDVLGGDLRNAILAGNNEELLRLLRVCAWAARWQPEMVVELSAFANALPAMNLGKVAVEWRRLIIAIEEKAAFPNDDTHQRLRVLAAGAWIDLRDSDKAAAVIHKYNEGQPPADRNYANGAARIWCMLAAQSGKEMPEAAAAAEKSLADETGPQRSITVNLLGQLYARMGKQDAELALFERELARPDAKQDDARFRAMTARLDMLRKGGTPAAQVRAAAAHWLSTHKLPWLDFAAPTGLDDRRIRDIDEELTDRGSFTPPEAVKLAVLVLKDTTQPETRTLQACDSFLRDVANLAPDDDTLVKWAETFATAPGLAEPFRAASLPSFMVAAFFNNRPAAFAKLSANPLCQQFQPLNVEGREVMKAWFEAAGADAATRKKYAAELLKKPLTPLTAAAFQKTIEQFITEGNLEAAQALYDEFAAAARTGRSGANDGQQLGLLKLIRTAREWAPVHDALREIVMRHYPAAPGAPASALRLLSPKDSLNQSEEEATKLRLEGLHAGRFSRAGLGFWSEFARDIPRDARSHQCVVELLEAALKNASNDETRNAVIGWVAVALDVDSAEDREIMGRLLKPWRGKSETADALRIHDLHVGLRTGTIGDGVAALRTIEDPRRLPFARRAVLRASLGSGDKQAVSRALDLFTPEELLSPDVVEFTLLACKLSGRKDEEALAAEKARRLAYMAVLAAWAGGATEAADAAYNLAAGLGDRALVPEAFARDFIPKVKHARQRLALECDDAVLRGEWKRLLTVAEEALRRFPSFHIFQWFKGSALMKLGDTSGAIAALQRYLEIVHDEPQVAEAKALLAELGKK